MRQRINDAADKFAGGEISSAVLARVEAALTPKIKAAEERARAAAVPPNLAALTGEGVDERWDALSIEQQREIVRLLLDVTVLPDTRPKGSRGFDPDAVRLEWRRLMPRPDVLQGAVSYVGQVAASHVGYELLQLAAMPKRHRQAVRDGKDHVAHACLESMLLHARNLIAFLIEGSTDADIHRSNFVQKWSPKKSPATRRLRTDRPMLDKVLSHLSWERVKNRTPDHDPARIAHDVVTVMGTFVEHLKKEAIPAAGWFQNDLHRARALLQEGPPVGHTSYTTSGAYGGVVVRNWPSSGPAADD